MGRSYRIRYTVTTIPANGHVHTPAEWRSGARYGLPGYGKPTDANLAAFVARFNASLGPAGSNRHLGEAHRAVAAYIFDHNTGKYIAEWTAPAAAREAA